MKTKSIHLFFSLVKSSGPNKGFNICVYLLLLINMQWKKGKTFENLMVKCVCH